MRLAVPNLKEYLKFLFKINDTLNTIAFKSWSNNLQLKISSTCVLICVIFSISLKTRDLEEKYKSLMNSYQIHDKNRFSIPAKRISIASISSSQFSTINIFGFHDAFHFFSKLSASLIDSVRGGSRTAATSKMERFVIIVNGWKPLTIITKRSILDVAAVLDPPLSVVSTCMAKEPTI